MLRLLAASMMGFAVLALPGSEVPKAMTSYNVASPMGKEFEEMAAQRASQRKREQRMRRVAARCARYRKRVKSYSKAEEFARGRMERKMQKYRCDYVERQVVKLEAKKSAKKEEKRIAKQQKEYYKAPTPAKEEKRIAKQQKEYYKAPDKKSKYDEDLM